MCRQRRTQGADLKTSRWPGPAPPPADLSMGSACWLLLAPELLSFFLKEQILIQSSFLNRNTFFPKYGILSIKNG